MRPYNPKAYLGRQHGKSTFNRIAMECALDAGKTVLIYKPGHAELMKRKGHLTSIKTINYKSPSSEEMMTWFDEWKDEP